VRLLEPLQPPDLAQQTGHVHHAAAVSATPRWSNKQANIFVRIGLGTVAAATVGDGIDGAAANLQSAGNFSL
jgi:hypothetical protein